MKEDQHTEFKRLFEQVRGGVMATIQREVFQKVQSGQITTGSTTPKTTPKTTRKALLEYIKEHPEATREEMATYLGITIDGVKYHIANLQKEGLLRRTKGRKEGHWEIIA